MSSTTAQISLSVIGGGGVVNAFSNVSRAVRGTSNEVNEFAAQNILASKAVSKLVSHLGLEEIAGMTGEIRILTKSFKALHEAMTLVNAIKLVGIGSAAFAGYKIFEEARATYKAKQDEQQSTQNLADVNGRLLEVISKTVDEREREAVITKKVADEYRNMIQGAKELISSGSSPAFVSGYIRDLAKSMGRGGPLTSQGIIDARRALDSAKFNATIQTEKDRISLQEQLNREAFEKEERKLDGYLARKRQLAIESNAVELKEIEKQEFDARTKLTLSDEEERLKALTKIQELNQQKKTLEIKLQKDLSEINAEQYRERKKQIDEIEEKKKKAAEEEEKRKREEMQMMREELEIIREVYDIRLRETQENFRLTDVQKREREIALLKEQVSLLGSSPQGLRARKDLAGKLAADDPNSVSDQVTKSFVGFKNQLGTTAQSIGEFAISPLTGMFQGLQSSIDGLIRGTMTWKQALVNLGSSILSSVITAFSQMIAKMLIIKALGWIFGGPAGSVAADGIGSAIPGANAGYASGGFTGFGSTSEVAGVVHRGEFVMPAPAVSRIGLPALQSIASGNSGGGSSSQMHVHFFDNRSDLWNAVQSKQGEQWVVDVMTRNAHLLRT